MDDQLVKSGWFKDWSGQRVPYRVWMTDADFRPFVCEVNAHGDSWNPMGTRSLTPEHAVASAKGAWNSYDQNG